jgi:hypothetical protein
MSGPKLRRDGRPRRFPASAMWRVGVVFAALAGLATFLPAGPKAALARVGTSPGTAAPGWQQLTNAPPFDPGAMYLLTDGTVMVQALNPGGTGSPNWWRLTPDSSGNYSDGTWTQVASLPANYGPGSYAAAVLPDGRLAIEGGEYNNNVIRDTNMGAIYDPADNAWTMVAPPNGGTGDWTRIGDAPSEVLADGRWLLGGSQTTADAIFDPSTLTWTATSGPGKLIANTEAGFTLLPDGHILSVDVVPPACTTRAPEMLDPATLEWASAGLTPAPLSECGNINEIGPQILMYNGKVFVEGATPATALFDVASQTWSSGPNFPVVNGQQQDASDAGAALLPDGNVFLASRTGEIQANGGVPTHFFVFDGTSLTQAPDNATSANGGFLYMLLLPTGQVLYNGAGPQGFEIFTDPGSPQPSWAPTITSYPTQLSAGTTYQLAGLQLNGLSDGAAFGDDYQSSTDYPLVQITNDGNGAVAYARTFGMTNRSIAPNAPSCTNFTLPAGIAPGASELRVIANGIASAPEPITVGVGGSAQNTCPNYTLSLQTAGTGTGSVNSSPAGIECGATCSHAYPDGTIVTLTAAPAVGSRFAGWSGGGCSGSDPCQVTLGSDTSVTATFTLLPETLAVAKRGHGKGTVKSAPAGIRCGSHCTQAYDYGNSVTLTATPAKNSSFAGWTGDCTGKKRCAVTMTADHAVTAKFIKDCVVPKLRGKRLKAARSLLKTHGCAPGKIRHTFSNKFRKGRVISQNPKSRIRRSHGTRVNLVVSKGRKG